ncbi:hypothetical protein Ade02nite_13890 [Paractinoplanes deccanensis]|uniref:Uncharacterized protein n=1 Tax=Paractinoplanes deccanensis TaxID=113561 RepID=A0ABQ3XYC0_9ACTN|nr:hypothetical protein [Actinoplanes deccanensis]GID72748.1 hypothetical protein Ade02nite_13890 [Actinoplanes deccanensis]
MAYYRQVGSVAPRPCDELAVMVGSVAPRPCDELAVMVGTFRPLGLGEAGTAANSGRYAWTWSA